MTYEEYLNSSATQIYSGQHIAFSIKDEKVVAHSEDLDSLVANLKTTEIDVSDIILGYIPKHAPVPTFTVN
jgi:hypothetical protein